LDIDRKWLSSIASEEGFVRDTLEKVYRLVEILRYINSNPYMRDCLALKGGTAINLTVFNLPRLSVDIDLDYSKNANREDMYHDREVISEDIEKYMISEGYQKSLKSKSRHLLFVLYSLYYKFIGNCETSSQS
jgi:predicted nucleotidyltransferase component of viral defense system